MSNLPIEVEGGVVTYVRADGKRDVLLQILRNGHGATLDIIEAVKAKLPEMQAAPPPELKIDLLADQSLFVRAALGGQQVKLVSTQSSTTDAT